MKRWLSLLLATALLVSLCMPTVHATPIEELRYQTPTGVAWGNGGEMRWESDYLTASPDGYFEGFQVALRYTTDDVGSVAEPRWDYLFSYDTYRTYPSLGDFSIPVSGYYSFSVRAYGEDMYGEDGWAYEYVSPWSDWSEPKYFETAPQLPAPTDLFWDGSVMHWSVADTTNVELFWIYAYYLEAGEERIVTSYNQLAQPNQTRYTLNLDDMGMDEEWLLSNGSRSYYFKVYSESSDATVASDSPWAKSADTLDFNENAYKLATPTGLYWDGNTMKWDVVEGVSYDVKLWFQRTELTPEEEAELGAAGGSSAEIFSPWEIEEYYGISGDDDWPVLNNNALYDQKGNYWFTVRARSSDLSQYLSSDWSSQSEQKYMEGTLQLNTPIWLTWQYDDADTLSWTWEAPAAQQAALRGFWLDVYYKAELSQEAQYLGSLMVRGNVTRTADWKQYANKDGYYSVKLYADSSNYNAFDGSDFSDFSADYWYDAADPLPAPTGLAWVGSRATWTPTASVEDAERYMVELYYCGADGTEEPQFFRGYSVGVDESSYLFRGDDFSRKGAGVYQFRVYAVTANPDKASDSEPAVSGNFTYTVPTASVAAPTGLYWDDAAMKWEIPADTTGIGGYEVNYYGDNFTEGYVQTVKAGEFFAIPRWEAESLGSNISFKVRAVSEDASKARDSDWVTCSTHYVPPAGLATPTNLAWDGSTMTWSWNGDASMLFGFYVEVYYAANESEKPVYCGGFVTDTNRAESNAWAGVAYAEGLYFFTVQAESQDVAVVGNSTVSEMSAGYRYVPAPQLPNPTGLTWDGSMVIWNVPDEAVLEYIASYEIHLYRAESGNYNIHRFYMNPRQGKYVIPTGIFEQYGPGTYTFAIRATSGDPAVYSNSGFVSSGGSFVYSEPKFDLPAPQNLRWEGATAKWDVVTDGSVGAYQVSFYNEGSTQVYNYDVQPGQFPTLNAYRINSMGNTIYFRVCAISANASNYGDSNWSVCGTTYAPAASLPVPVDLAWKDGVMTWSWIPETDAQAEALDVFGVEIYYGATADAEPELLGARGVMGSRYAQWTDLAVGDGWYYFRVNAESGNVALAQSSAWSGMSPGYQYSMPDPVAPPTNLRWDRSTIVWDASTADLEISWQYLVTLYYHNSATGEDEYVSRRYVTNMNGEKTLQFAFPTILMESRGNGEYKVSIVALSRDGAVASNSKPVWSSVYNYTNPNVALEKPSNLRWEGATAKWDLPADTSNIAYYEVTIFGADDPYNGYVETAAPGSFVEVDHWYVAMLGESIGFSVSAVSKDANGASDSAEATCSTYFTYAPVPLAAPQNLQYNASSGQLTWDVVANAQEYTVEVWYAESADAEAVRYDYYYVDGQDANVFFHPEEQGDYTFRVQATSNSALYTASDWTECRYSYQTATVEEVNAELEAILADNSSAAAAAEAIKAMDAQSLANAMTAPQDENNTVVEQIAKLESRLETNSAINVDDAVMDLLPSEEIQVVGAALNADSGTVTLSIQAESEDMPALNTEKYAFSVPFSMHLVDDKEAVIEELAAPVWIKLPVPQGMNPSLLQILHYSGDGLEVILPAITQEGGQWYASFAVTGFSDFAIAMIKLDAYVEEGNTVRFAAWLNIRLDGMGICAVYDQDGRMIGVTQIDDLSGDIGTTIECDGAPASVKLFLMDSETCQPTYLEIPCIMHELSE